MFFFLKWSFAAVNPPYVPSACSPASWICNTDILLISLPALENVTSLSSSCGPFCPVHRRIGGDLICVRNIMHGLSDFPCDTVFNGLRGHAFKVHQQRCKNQCRQYAFIVRVVLNGISCQRRLWTLCRWKYSRRFWMYNGSLCSLKVPVPTIFSPKFVPP